MNFQKARVVKAATFAANFKGQVSWSPLNGIQDLTDLIRLEQELDYLLKIGSQSFKCISKIPNAMEMKINQEVDMIRETLLESFQKVGQEQDLLTSDLYVNDTLQLFDDELFDDDSVIGEIDYMGFFV